MKFIYLSLVVFIFTSLNGYAQEEEQPVSVAEQKANLVENIKSQVAGNNAFAQELYNRLKTKPGNLFCSPYCISSALVLPYAGSAGPTRAQFHTVLRYLTQEDSLFATFSWLNQHFTTPWYSGPNETRLYIANSLWIQRDFKILPKFMDIATKYFKSTLKLADFLRNPESSRQNINSWVKERTQGRIDQLLQPGEINSSTRLVVVSSIFMKAVWEHAFDPNLTTADSFFVNKTQTASVPMMTTTANFPYYQNNTFTILEMPYRGGEAGQTQFSLLVFLPKDTYGLSSVENHILDISLENLLKSLRMERVIVSFPKFKFSSEFELNNTLQQMGMIEAFSENADFSGIDGERDLSLNHVIHKAYLSVDEKGTEAVAATAVTMEHRSVVHPESTTVFRADHPFMFMIIDKSINAILFTGRFVSP